MLVGAGALGATDEVIAVAERLGAGVAKALLGKAAVPDDLPFCTGSIGLLGTKASWDLMQDCDTLLMVGSGFPYAEFLPQGGPGAGRADRHQCRDAGPALPDGGQPRRRRGRDACAALLPLLEPKADRSWRETIEASRRAPGDEVRSDGAAARRSDQSAAGRVHELSRAPARSLHRHGRQRHDHRLVRAQSALPARHDGLGLRHARHDGLRAFPTPSRRSSPIRTAR